MGVQIEFQIVNSHSGQAIYKHCFDLSKVKSVCDLKNLLPVNVSRIPQYGKNPFEKYEKRIEKAFGAFRTKWKEARKKNRVAEECFNEERKKQLKEMLKKDDSARCSNYWSQSFPMEQEQYQLRVLLDDQKVTTLPLSLQMDVSCDRADSTTLDDLMVKHSKFHVFLPDRSEVIAEIKRGICDPGSNINDVRSYRAATSISCTSLRRDD